MKPVIITGIAVLFLATGTFQPANATNSGCAVVLRTPDGFLNVRDESKMGSRIVAQVKPGDILYIDDKTICDENSCNFKPAFTG